MQWLLLLGFFLGLVPWWRALVACRYTSLGHALVWVLVAWMTWGLVLAGAADQQTGRYFALCLTACAGVAVLGARRPHLGAWNFVVLGLLAVMMLPKVEEMLLGTPSLGPVRISFLGAALAVGIGNYVPTRLGPAALLLGLVCAGEMLALFAPGLTPAFTVETRAWLLAVVPWCAAFCWRRPGPLEHGFDRSWRLFRDRFGALWGLRIRDMFNQAARHAGWNVCLTWQGLAPRCKAGLPDTNAAELDSTLQALLKRFDTARRG